MAAIPSWVEYSRNRCGPCAKRERDDATAAAAEAASKEMKQRAENDAHLEATLRRTLDALDSAGRPGLIFPKQVVGYEKYGLLKHKTRTIYRESPPAYPVGRRMWRYKHVDAEGTSYEFVHEFQTGVLPAGAITIIAEEPDGAGAELEFGQREYVINSLYVFAKRHGVSVD